jgi:hypothetical protein
VAVPSVYDVVTLVRAGKERHHRYASEEPLAPGAVIRVDGRDWLIERIEPGGDELAGRAFAKPARYRVRLRHPDGREELGAFRRFRPDAPRLGHTFSTIEDGQPSSWQVMDERPAYDEKREPYLELLAERDFAEFEQLPDHELEHALAARDEELPPGASAVFARAEEGGLSVELVALEPGEEPDWAEAARYIDALIIEEIDDDLLVRCGVEPENDPRDAWLGIVKERLRADLESFRGDIEGDLDEIEEWDFRDGRIFASVGHEEDEADPNSGHGWMCRLVDASALGAAGFARVRKAELWGPVT